MYFCSFYVDDLGQKLQADAEMQQSWHTFLNALSK